MEFLKIRSFRGIGKFKVKKDSNQDRDLLHLDLDKPTDEVLDTMPKVDASDPVVKVVEDEDDDDFITNEVKRRLKELRKNSFMVLIPEEGYPEEEEREGCSSSRWRESEEGGDAPWLTFNAIYAKYTERMTFFDKLMVKSLKEAGMLVLLAKIIIFDPASGKLLLLLLFLEDQLILSFLFRSIACSISVIIFLKSAPVVNAKSLMVRYILLVVIWYQHISV